MRESAPHFGVRRPIGSSKAITTLWTVRNRFTRCRLLKRRKGAPSLAACAAAAHGMTETEHEGRFCYDAASEP